jgi:hypothetical protein
MAIFGGEKSVTDKLKAENARRATNATQLRAAEAALAACCATVNQLALDGDEGKLESATGKQHLAEIKLTALRAASKTIGATIADLEKEAASIADKKLREATAEEIRQIAVELDRPAKRS